MDIELVPQGTLMKECVRRVPVWEEYLLSTGLGTIVEQGKRSLK
jgi:hypothetical protein